MEDETINGAKIAAEILNRMDPERKDRIVKKIQAADPQIAGKIEENLFSFEEIATLTPKSLQMLLSQVAREDLVLAMKASSADVQNKIFDNMSSRHAQMLEEEILSLAPTLASQAREAQRRILEQLENLRREGKILTEGAGRDLYV